MYEITAYNSRTGAKTSMTLFDLELVYAFPFLYNNNTLATLHILDIPAVTRWRRTPISCDQPG